MKHLSLLVALLFVGGLLELHAQTINVSASNTDYLEIIGEGKPNFYPSEITVSGAAPYISGILLEFSKFYIDGPARDLDIMLESPSGKRVMILSDLPHFPIPYIPAIIRLSSNANATLDQPGEALYPSAFLPANLGAAPDSFPAPGPGLLTAASASFAELINENPNGVWKLWVMDDSTSYNYFALWDGWTLNLETSDTPVCIQPALPAVQAVTDTTAQITWKGEGPATNWDIFYVLEDDHFPAPNEQTTPQIANWADDTIVLDHLLPAKAYQFYIRSVCPDGSKSRWRGPINFTTLLTPCLYANPIALNQVVESDTVSALPEYNLGLACGDATRWIYRFTAPETGKYWVNTDQFTTIMWMHDDPASSECPVAQWTCGNLDTLPAGASVFVMLTINTEIWDPPVFNISRCPASGVTLQQATFEPLTTSIRFVGAVYDETSRYDLFYTQDSTFIPKAATVPLESDISIYPANDQAIHPLAAHDLMPESKYWVWYRPRCEEGVATGVWKGPFSFQTAIFCGAIDSVWIDEVTDHSARLHFVAPSHAIIEAKVKIKSSGQGVIPYSITFYPDSAGQVLTRTIISIEPDIEYELFLKATCSFNGENPWYGPFPFKTKPGCFLDVRDIQCGEQVGDMHFSDTIPDAYWDFYHSACNVPWQHGTLNERLFRFEASKTGYAELDYGTDNGQSYLRWFIKDASLGCNASGFERLSCGEAYTAFEVDSGKTYLLVAEGAHSDVIGSDFHAGFYLSNCAPLCPTTDSIWVDGKTATSVSLRWQNISPGATYRVYYQNDVDGEIRFAETTDTSTVIKDLLTNGEYVVWVATFCPGGEPNTHGYITVQLGDHAFIRQCAFSRCNPYYLPPGRTKVSNYEVFELEVPQDGDYRLFSSKWSNLWLYDSIFDPDNPTQHLLLSATEPYTIGGPIDTIASLQTGKTYQWVVSTNASNPAFYAFNDDGYPDLKLIVDGPAEANLTEPLYKGIEPRAHGKVPFEFVGYHTGTCRDTSGWVHYYVMATDSRELLEDKLLLSVQLDKDADSLNMLPMVLYNDPPLAALIHNPPAMFVQNPDGWYEMNRSWIMENLLPAQQIDQDFKVRFYYTEQDYALMKTAIEAAGGKLETHEAMYFHKINGFHNQQAVLPWGQHAGVPGAPSYDSVGYWSYVNGPEASTSTWRHGTYAGEHYAEMVVHGFSGGGGGASVNGHGVFDPVSGTDEQINATALGLTPNPTTGTFSIELAEPAESGMSLRISSLLGLSIKEEAIQMGSKTQTVLAGALPAGFYFLQVVSEGKVMASEKFMKL